MKEVVIVSVARTPIGSFMGYGLGMIMASAFATELFRVPMIMNSSTYATAMLICISATIASGLIVRRRVNGLNMIRVLKTRE